MGKRTSKKSTHTTKKKRKVQKGKPIKATPEDFADPFSLWLAEFLTSTGGYRITRVDLPAPLTAIAIPRQFKILARSEATRGDVAEALAKALADESYPGRMKDRALACEMAAHRLIRSRGPARR